MAETRKAKPKPGSTGTAAKARPQDTRGGGGRGRQPDKGKLAKGAAARRLQEKKRRQRTLLWSGVAVFSLLALVALIYFEGRQDQPTTEPKRPVDQAALTAARQAAGSTGLKTFPEAGRDHIDANQQPRNWNSNPPTSGDHLASPLPPGVYDNEQDPRALVHNLEHGYVVIFYKNLPQDQLDQLRQFAEARDGTKLVLAPYSGLAQDGIALAAWRNLETMQRYNQDVVQAFVNDYMVPDAPRSEAPEPNAA